MKHPFSRFIRLELFAISLMFIIGIVALVKKATFLILFCLFLLVLSLLFDGLTHYHTYQRTQAGKQFLKAIMLLLFTVYLLFHI